MALGAVLSFDGEITLEFDRQARLVSMTIDPQRVDALAKVDGLQGNVWTLAKKQEKVGVESLVLVKFEPEKFTFSYIQGRWVKQNSTTLKWELLERDAHRKRVPNRACDSPQDAARFALRDANIIGDEIEIAEAPINTIENAIASLIGGSSSAVPSTPSAGKKRRAAELLPPTSSTPAPCATDSAEATES